MPFNVVTIKEKASNAKNATVTKIQDKRDRYSSAPMAKSKFAEAGYVPDARKQPPPPPPSRSINFAQPAPPPISRNSKPGNVSSQFNPVSGPSRGNAADISHSIDRIDWANLSPDDKQEFFSWLDEFFARYLNVSGTSRTLSSPDLDTAVNEIAEPLSKPSTVASSSEPNRGPPPVIKKWSKPVTQTTNADTDASKFEMSYPPQTMYGSQAGDLAHYFHPDTHWDTQWYTEPSGMPPPLRDNNNRLWKGMFSYKGNMQTTQMVVLFSDLSVCWASVTFNKANPSDAQRHAEYLTPPTQLSKDVLIEAHETYGETIAAFAESFLQSGQFCARGECWDLANEAIKYFEQFDYVPKPIPSLNRTHGHLIFEGRALGKGKQVGRWRGGDDRVRRGDIVEWRSVKINFVNAVPGSWAILGDPEHTAVITKDSIPTRSPQDGRSLLPSELVSLEVVEQSRNNQPPEPNKKTYDMAAFEEGEVWIYRPIALEVYLGIPDLTPTSSEGVRDTLSY